MLLARRSVQVVVVLHSRRYYTNSYLQLDLPSCDDTVGALTVNPRFRFAEPLFRNDMCVGREVSLASASSLRLHLQPRTPVSAVTTLRQIRGHTAKDVHLDE